MSFHSFLAGNLCANFAIRKNCSVALLVQQIEEFIDVIINGKAGDSFNQFDIVLSGVIPFPRVHARFFEPLRWGVPVGGFIYLEFSKAR